MISACLPKLDTQNQSQIIVLNLKMYSSSDYAPLILTVLLRNGARSGKPTLSLWWRCNHTIWIVILKPDTHCAFTGHIIHTLYTRYTYCIHHTHTVHIVHTLYTSYTHCTHHTHHVHIVHALYTPTTPYNTIHTVHALHTHHTRAVHTVRALYTPNMRYTCPVRTVHTLYTPYTPWDWLIGLWELLSSPV